MKETLAAVGIAASLLASPAAEAWGGGYGYGYSEPRPVSHTFNTSTCVGMDKLTARTSVIVEDYAGYNNQNASAVAQTTKNLLQGEWNRAVIDNQYTPDMLMQSFQMGAEYAASEASAMHGVNVQAYPQTYSIQRGGCGQQFYSSPRHHHHHRHNNWNFGLPFPY